MTTGDQLSINAYDIINQLVQKGKETDDLDKKLSMFKKAKEL